MWRRGVSQAIDRMIAAVRMGCSLEEVDALLEASVAARACARQPNKTDGRRHTAEPSEREGFLLASPHPMWLAAMRLRLALTRRELDGDGPR